MGLGWSDVRYIGACRDMTRPKILKTSGVVIAPLKYSKGVEKEAASQPALTSAPSPKRYPSLKRVLALWKTQALSTRLRKSSAAAWSSGARIGQEGKVANERCRLERNAKPDAGLQREGQGWLAFHAVAHAPAEK